jgi:5-(carboxyamino)imidazole ribonucleotide synthase
MMILEGAPLGVRFRVLDTADSPCASELAPTRRADWRDETALAELAGAVDVATFDFENVPAETARWLTDRVRVHPGPQALAVAQDRMAEKTMFREIGLDTAQFAVVDTRADLDAALQSIGTPSILKTRRLGYDGKGQYRLQGAGDADAAWDALGDQAARHGLILESFVPFDYEVSVIAARGRDGDFRTWPLTRNWHVDGILSLSLAPAPAPAAIAAQAFAHARMLAERLDYVGVFALELFVHKDRVLGNEMAPRVHNSGHWTYDGAVTSQFQNHVRAVLGLPLGDTSARGLSVMFNWIGAMPDITAALAVEDVHWHDYGKSARPGRKVGHATVCAPDVALLRDRVHALADALGRGEQAAPLLDLELDRV